jgi:diguanylate cyclase (GGDEF)-like protein
MLVPSPPPSVLVDRAEEDLGLLGEALQARITDVLDLTIARTIRSGEVVDAVVQQSFERICRSSTLAVARWIAGESLEVVEKAGRETWQVFGELAAHRAASLHEVTRRCLLWRNAMAEVLQETATELEAPPEVLSRAFNLLQLSLEFSLLRMCRCFEEERRRTDEKLAQREEELAFLATHDALTGLPNRTLVLDRIEQMHARSSRRRTPVVALSIDLDNFKGVNDTLGRAIGDELLCAVAARLQAAVRHADTVGRLGGNEYVVISEELALAASPELVAERLLDALKYPFELGADEETSLTVTASIGIAAGARSSAEALMRDADIAMHRAKRDGKNRHVMFDTDMQDTIQECMELEIDVRAALDRDEFSLLYQPTFDLHDIKPVGVEALLCWNHPARGVIQPATFIPLLEETGLIVEVGRWALREACRQGAAWRRDGLSIDVAVNVSGRQLDTDRLIDDIEGALAAGGLDAGALMIEITETTLMCNIEETAHRLAQIKQLGVRIAIDDFGTGYSSLAHLQRFPVDALKIDRSFVAGMSANKEGETLIHTLVHLGKALSIETLAEGIEREQDLALLKDAGCDSGQGFLFAHPLDSSEIGAFFMSWVAPTRQPVPAG